MNGQFAENLSIAVFTTKFVLENHSPILFVFHYKEDGSWQFSGAENIISEKDYRIISLKEIIELDRTVLELADLPLGSEAYRQDVKSPWIIK